MAGDVSAPPRSSPLLCAEALMNRHSTSCSIQITNLYVIPAPREAHWEPSIVSARKERAGKECRVLKRTFSILSTDFCSADANFVHDSLHFWHHSVKLCDSFVL